ncbi:MAG: hypothetical protein Q9172_000549 [Xanthocarpia lactea]
MAAVASSSRAESVQDANSETVNEGRPSFTAVNGSNSPAPPNRPKEQLKESKEEDNRTPRASIQAERPKSPVPIAPGHEKESVQQERRPSPPQEAAEDRPPPNYTHPHDLHHSQNNHSHTPNGQLLTTTNNGAPKRKRSYPDEYDQPNSSTYHNHGLPPSPQRPRMYPQENGNGRERDHGTPDTYGRPDRVDAPELYPRQERSPPPAENYPQPERHSLVRNEYDNRVEGNIAPGRPYYSEARMAEALQRENNSYEPMPMHESQFGSPDDDDENQHGQQYGDYGGTPRTQAQRDLDRTRHAARRSVTSCIQNSKNGGYPQPMGRNGPPSYSRYGPDHGPEYPGPPPMGQGMHPSHDGERMKPILVDEERNLEYNEGPNGQGKPPYPKAARPYPSNPPYASKYEPGDERPVSNHDNASYPAQDPNSMHPPPNVGGRSNSVHSQYSAQSSQPPPHSNVQGIAQTALHLRPSPPQRPRNDMTERDKMLKGNYYSPFTPALTQDRENCMAAIWRFNNATNPSHGASFEERQRRFREIMACRPTPELGANGSNNPQASIMPVGRVGENCAVEAPFHCDYGYNINIGNDVLIGADCRISDTCSVTIGDRCIFSPNVKLVCATYPIDPRRRQGSSGQALGRNIVIEEDCWIGSNVTILAGVRVGKSSTVGAGSLLHQDVPRFTVVAGNPAKVSRGIYDGSADAQ